MKRHGIEQEFQLINERGALVPRAKEVLESVPDELKRFGKGGIYQDKYATQLEIATDAVTDMAVMEEQLVLLRGALVEATEKKGLCLMATGANPLGNARVGEFFSEHHHVEAGTDGQKLLYSNFLRNFVPDLMAMSTNSPVYMGRRTAYKCYRASSDGNRRPNPNIKPPPYLTRGDIERGYLLVCADGPEDQLDEQGIKVARRRSRYFDVSPFTKPDKATGRSKPTVEVRFFDSQPLIPITLGYAAVIQAMALKADGMARAGIAVPNIMIAANREAAISSGLQARFMAQERKRAEPAFAYHLGSLSRSMIPADQAWTRLLGWLEPEIGELDLKKYVGVFEQMIKHRTNIADRQLRLFQSGMDAMVTIMSQRTMSSFDSTTIPTGPSVKAEPVGAGEQEFSPAVSRGLAKLRAGLRQVTLARMPEWALAQCLVVLGSLGSKTDEPMIGHVMGLLEKGRREDGSIDGDMFRTASYLDAMMACSLTAEKSFRSSLAWLLDRANRGLPPDQVWLAAYVVSVLNKSGVPRPKLNEAVHWLKSRMGPDGSFGDVWVTAFGLEALSLVGEETRSTRNWLINNQRESRWAQQGMDPVVICSIVTRAFRRMGEVDNPAVSWLREQLGTIRVGEWKDLYKVALILQSIA